MHPPDLKVVVESTRWIGRIRKGLPYIKDIKEGILNGW
jgi:hypothetical protein